MKTSDILFFISIAMTASCSSPPTPVAEQRVPASVGPAADQIECIRAIDPTSAKGHGRNGAVSIPDPKGRAPASVVVVKASAKDPQLIEAMNHIIIKTLPGAVDHVMVAGQEEILLSDSRTEDQRTQELAALPVKLADGLQACLRAQPQLANQIKKERQHLERYHVSTWENDSNE